MNVPLTPRDESASRSRVAKRGTTEPQRSTEINNELKNKTLWNSVPLWSERLTVPTILLSEQKRSERRTNGGLAAEGLQGRDYAP
jgi:hypothetical protein